MRLLISGSVGAGKSTIAKELSKVLKINVYEVTDLEKINPKIIESVDEEGVKILDLKEINKTLENFDSFIFPCHVAHLLNIKDSKLLIVRAGLPELRKRLVKRGYSEKKIKDNLDVEIFNTIMFEALENKGFDAMVVNNEGKLKKRVEMTLKNLKV